MLSIRQIAERFIQLYWHQATPYGTGCAGSTSAVLSQSCGTQAAIVSAIATFRSCVVVSSVQAAQTMPAFQPLLTIVARIVSAQPLNYLQNFGGGTDEFLYERAGTGRLRLKPGVAYCLRRFQSLAQQLARSYWIGHIKGNHRNHSILGQTDDLEEFLFRTSRRSLAVLAAGLRQIDGAVCFYCGGTLGTAAPDVDHFIAFSQYPRDLAHNFVLAHPRCNRSKSAALAGRPHLARWLTRLLNASDDIAAIGVAAGMVADASSSRQIAKWGYTTAMHAGGRAWLAPTHYENVDSDYQALLLA